jgi:hypothetical protein
MRGVVVKSDLIGIVNSILLDLPKYAISQTSFYFLILVSSSSQCWQFSLLGNLKHILLHHLPGDTGMQVELEHTLLNSNSRIFLPICACNISCVFHTHIYTFYLMQYTKIK